MHATRFLVCVLAALAVVTNATIRSQFGHNMREQFLLASGYTNLNHGSFGAIPKFVWHQQTEHQLHTEQNPDKWFRYESYNALDAVRKQVARYVSADEEDVVFVINASQGVNSVLRSIHLESSSKILFLSTAYPMVKNTLGYLHNTFAQQLIQLNVTFPTNDDQIVDLVRSALDADKTNSIKMAVFSHITSVPAIILPVKRLTELCHSRGIMVLVDGAHTIGHIPVNVTDINSDFYVSNGHKWLYTPKGSAMLWVRKDRQSLIYPTTISEEGVGKTQFQLEFSWVGTMDYSAYLCFSAALEFRESVGGDTAIMSYIHDLAVKGGHVLANMWGTELLVSDKMIGAMVNVRIPVEPNSTVVQHLPDRLLEKYNTWVPVFPIFPQGYWWVRVSAQIYNDITDFEMLGRAVLALL